MMGKAVKKMTDQEQAVINAAKRWWLSHRPIGWGECDHLDAADINCVTQREKELANAVAAAVTSPDAY